MPKSVGRHALVQGSCPCGFCVDNLTVGMTTFADRDPVRTVVVYTADGEGILSVDQNEAEEDGLTIIDCRQTVKCPRCSTQSLSFIFGEIVFSD
jgi:hypothetical protein